MGAYDIIAKIFIPVKAISGENPDTWIIGHAWNTESGYSSYNPALINYNNNILIWMTMAYRSNSATRFAKNGSVFTVSIKIDNRTTKTYTYTVTNDNSNYQNFPLRLTNVPTG